MSETLEQKLGPEEYIAAAWEEVVMSSIPEGHEDLAYGILIHTLDAYSEDNRVYHTLAHVADCLQKLEPYQDREDYQELWLALFWHDVVYDVMAKDNEEQSATLASHWMDELDLPNSEAVTRLIVSTKKHEGLQEDEALVCDIDMSILATETEQYHWYANAFYEEYVVLGGIPLYYFIAGRRNFLADAKDTQVFHHPDFAHLNQQAATNLSAEYEEKMLIAVAPIVPEV